MHSVSDSPRAVAKVAASELEGLRVRASDAAALLVGISEEIEALEALGDARQVTR